MLLCYVVMWRLMQRSACNSGTTATTWSFLLTVGSEGSQRSQRADRWDELHLKATCRWVLVRFRQVGAGQVPHLAFGRASGSGNLTRWVQTAPSREVLRDVSRVGSE